MKGENMDRRKLAIGERNNFSKLSEDEVRTIRYLAETNTVSQRKLAKMFNVHRSCIYLILTRKNWSHI